MVYYAITHTKTRIIWYTVRLTEIRYYNNLTIGTNYIVIKTTLIF